MTQSAKLGDAILPSFVDRTAIRRVQPVSSSRAWAAQILLSLLYILSFLDRLILVLLIEPIKAELGVTDVQIGLLIGASFAIVYSLAGLPFARLADVGSRTLLIFAGAMLWGLSTAGAAFAGGFAALLVLRAGVAVGEATLTPAAMSLIADMFPAEKRGLPTSIYILLGVCGGCGGMIFGAAVLQIAGSTVIDLPWIGHLAPWRLTLLLVGLPAAVLALLVPIILPRIARTEPRASTESESTIVTHFRQNARSYVALYGAMLIASSINFSMLTWYPTHLIRSYGVSASGAGYSFGVIGMLASIAGGLLLPLVSRRMIARGVNDAPLVVTLAANCIAAPLFVAALVVPTAAQSMAWVTLPLTLQFGIGVLLASNVPVLAPSGARAQLYAIFNLILTLAGLGAAPTAVAWIAENVTVAGASIGTALSMVIIGFAPLMALVVLPTRKAFAASLERAISARQE